MTSVVAPHCMWCKHYKRGLACDAYPKRIPEDILYSESGHTEPHTGDGGIMFELKEGETDEWVGLKAGG